MGALAIASLTITLSGCGGSAGDSGSDGSRNGESRAESADTSEQTKESEDLVAEDPVAEDPVAKMSVEELVGQMFVVSVQGTESDYYIERMIRKRNIGGAILFGYNMQSESQVATLTSQMQSLSMKTEPSIPMFVGVDYEGGEVAGAPWVTSQPAAAEVGASGDSSRARAVAREIGTELSRAGVNTDFSPVVDTGFGAAIGSRSYGEDPALVSKMGTAAIKGFEDAGVVDSAKHFPNHGPATTDSHETLPVIDHDMQTVRSHDLPPFEAAVKAGVPMVMVSHLLYPAIDPENPASLSPKAIGMLRDDLGFGGVIVTDDLVMKGATGDGTSAEAAVRAVEAGADLMIISSPPEDQAAAYDAVVAAVKSGDVPEEQVRDSVERILDVKREYSLYGVGKG